jgi:exonuclease SbcD
MVARLLFIGDMHLGRTPSRLPDDLEELGLRRSELGPAAAWRASIDHALSSEVDAVVLAGDVVEGIDDRFEAYRDLKAGALRLAAAGIPLIGVAGNHDVEALPRLARQIPAFRLLGAAGRWETVDVATHSGVPLRLLGWSFPAQRVERNPLDSLDLESARQRGVATLGVLHCDVDAGSSRYAPVSSRALAALPVDGFLLGHVHRPDRLEGDRPQGYLGSLVGLDPGVGCGGIAARDSRGAAEEHEGRSPRGPRTQVV